MVDNVDDCLQLQLQPQQRQQQSVAKHDVAAEVPISLQELAAEWQADKYRRQSQSLISENEVMLKVQEVTKLLRDSKGEEPGSLQKMEWDSLYDVSANVMDEYTRSVDTVLAELDQLYRKQYLWQEAAFVMDSHRGATMIGRAEEWMKFKEQHLGYKRKELEKSASVIRKTVERLTGEK